MQPTAQQLQIRLAELTGEIKIAERKHEDIHRDLERLDQAKSEERKLHAQETKAAKDALAEITTLLQEKRDLYATLTENYENLQKEVKEYNNTELQKAKTERDRIIAAAETIHDKATAKRDEAEELEYTVANCITAIEETENQMYDDTVRLSRKEAELKSLQQATDKAVEESKILIVENTQILDNLLRDVKDQTEIKAKLDRSVKEAIEFMNDTKREAETILAEAKRLKNISQKEREANEKENDRLITESKRLADWAETLGRSYREILQRGGTVNA